MIAENETDRWGKAERVDRHEDIEKIEGQRTEADKV